MNTKLYKQVLGFARAFPLITIFSTFLSYFLTNDIDLLLFSIFLVSADLFNHFLKSYIFKPLMGIKSLLLLGKGTRPIGAKKCSIFVENPPKSSKSYGMPSGHSQNAVLFATYGILKLLDNQYTGYMKIIGIMVFLILAVGVMYSRIYFGCHTIQQVFVGGFLGLILGTVFYKKKNNIINAGKKIYSHVLPFGHNQSSNVKKGTDKKDPWRR